MKSHILSRNSCADVEAFHMTTNIERTKPPRESAAPGKYLFVESCENSSIRRSIWHSLIMNVPDPKPPPGFVLLLPKSVEPLLALKPLFCG